MKERILEIIEKTRDGYTHKGDADGDINPTRAADEISQMFCDEMAKKFHEIGFFIFDLEGLLLPFGFTKEQIELSLSKLK